MGEGEGQKKLRNTFQRLWPEEFSSAGDFGPGDFGLGRNLRYLRPKTPHFPERGGGGSEGEGDGRRGGGGDGGG